MVIFVYGGAWINGERSLYSLLGKTLSESGFVVVIPDYTLYPKSKIEGMLDELREAVRWTRENCQGFGGDSNRVFLCGHSAGAQLVSIGAVLDALGPESEPSLITGVKGIIG